MQCLTGLAPFALSLVLDAQNDVDTTALPKLPSHARYLFHENTCFDWGTFGWAIQKSKVVRGDYAYFIFMNTSVRGPILPAYWPVRDAYMTDALPS